MPELDLSEPECLDVDALDLSQPTVVPKKENPNHSIEVFRDYS